MSLSVGTDTYLSLVDANTYVSGNYPSSSTQYTSWIALSDSDKEVYLRKATKQIDKQMLIGIKAIGTQTLEFPRAMRANNLDYTDNITYLFKSKYWVTESEVSQEVKDAQVEIALYLLVENKLTSTPSKRQSLQNQGVKKFTIDDISEEYDLSLVSNSNSPYLPEEARYLLRKYLANTFKIV